jgi:hypothetical protein
MRLKVKEGTHKTSVNVRLAEMTTVPVCVTGTTKPFGSLKNVETTAVIVVKRDGQLIIWSVAPVSIIQGVDLEQEDENFGIEIEEKTECLGLR